MNGLRRRSLEYGIGVKMVFEYKAAIEGIYLILSEFAISRTASTQKQSYNKLTKPRDMSRRL